MRAPPPPRSRRSGSPKGRRPTRTSVFLDAIAAALGIVLEELLRGSPVEFDPGVRHRAREVLRARDGLGDAYRLVGVTPEAPREVVEAAYRARAKTLHPDAGGDPERFKRLAAAMDRIRVARGWRAG